MKETTHFGFQEVPIEEKTYRVREVFNSVARRYDLMNDLMSADVSMTVETRCDRNHRYSSGMQILDLASGTGDLTRSMSHRAGPDGHGSG